MTVSPAHLPPDGHGHFARDFISAAHRDLPLVRVLLPPRDDDDRPVRWSAFLSMEEMSAGMSWWEVVDRVADEHPEIRDLTPSQGRLDKVTAAALREAFDGRVATCLRWAGYAEASRATTVVRVYENDCVSTPFAAAELQAEEQVPEFVWDAAGEFAWGTHLYPDSLVIACEWEIFRALHTDPRLDVITVRADRDVVPASSGD